MGYIVKIPAGCCADVNVYFQHGLGRENRVGLWDKPSQPKEPADFDVAYLNVRFADRNTHTPVDSNNSGYVMFSLRFPAEGNLHETKDLKMLNEYKDHPGGRELWRPSDMRVLNKGSAFHLKFDDRAGDNDFNDVLIDVYVREPHS